jgi:hypothetical protein
MKTKTPSSIYFALFVFTFSISGFRMDVDAQPASTSSFVLRDGVVVNPVRKEIYISSPDGRVQAIAEQSGEILWGSDMQGKPLAMANGNLVVQYNNPAKANDLGFAVLDVTQRGAIKSRNLLSLPPQVKADFRPQLNSSFSVVAKTISGVWYLQWDYMELPKKGMDQPEAIVKESGAATMKSGTLKVSGIDKARLPKDFEKQSIFLEDAPQIPDGKSPKFISKDGKNILTSEQVAKDSVFNHYRWQIFELGGKKITEISDYRSYAPFYVAGTLLVYEIGPYIRVINGIAEEQPLQLIAVELSSGKEIWRRSILDTIYRGPTPP